MASQVELIYFFTTCHQYYSVLACFFATNLSPHLEYVAFTCFCILWLVSRQLVCSGSDAIYRTWLKTFSRVNMICMLRFLCSRSYLCVVVLAHFLFNLFFILRMLSYILLSLSTFMRDIYKINSQTCTLTELKYPISKFVCNLFDGILNFYTI